MYVAVYSLSVSSTLNARAMEASQYSATVNMINENQKSQGVKAALDKATDDAEKDKAYFQKGFKEGQAKAKPQSENSVKVSSKNSNTTPSTESNSRSKLTVVSVSITGVGFNSKDAIKDGLVQAISQVNGLQMSSQTFSSMASFETVKDGDETFASSSSFQEKVKQSTKGIIQSWQIISIGKNQSGEMFAVSYTHLTLPTILLV